VPAESREHERAKIAQLGSGGVAAEGVDNCRRADDLAAVGDGTDPRNFVPGQAEVLAAGDGHGFAVDADPHPASNAVWPAVLLDSLLRHHRRCHSVPRGREDVKHAVALAADRAAVMGVERSLEHPLVHSQQHAAPLSSRKSTVEPSISVNRSVAPALRISHRDAFSQSIQIMSPGIANPPRSAMCAILALPYATDHSIELHELRKVRRDGTVETPHCRLVQPESRSLPITVRMPTPAGSRTRGGDGPHNRISRPPHSRR
jgi:hypothetical protein